MSFRMKQSQFIRRNPNCEYNCEKINLKDYEVPKDKAIMLCLSGTASYTLEEGNGFCNMGENLIGLKDDENTFATRDNVEVLGVAYGQDHRFASWQLSDDDIDLIIKKILLPLIQDKNENILPIEEASKNISQVTFFTYCHGAIETAKIIRNLYYNLKYKGVSEEDIMELFSHTRQVSFAPNTPADYIPSVRVESLQDVESKYFNGGFESFYFRPLKAGVEVIYDEAGHRDNDYSHYGLMESVSIVSNQMLNKLYDQFDNETATLLQDSLDEHYVSIIARNKEDWKLRLFQIHDDITNRDLKIKSKNADAVSQMLGYALASFVANGIQNSKSDTIIKKQPMQELAKDLDSIRMGFSRADLER